MLTVYVLTSNFSGFIYFKWHNPTQCNPSQSKSCHIHTYIISDWPCFAGTSEDMKYCSAPPDTSHDSTHCHCLCSLVVDVSTYIHTYIRTCCGLSVTHPNLPPNTTIHLHSTRCVNITTNVSASSTCSGHQSKVLAVAGVGCLVHLWGRLQQVSGCHTCCHGFQGWGRGYSTCQVCIPCGLCLLEGFLIERTETPAGGRGE